MTLPVLTGYGWNENAQRYIDLDTGRFIPMSSVRDALESVMDAAAVQMNDITSQLQAGTISLADWQTGMMDNIRVAHTAAGASANGGWDAMTQSDWGFVGQRIRDQYDFVRNFAGQIADGTQPLDGRVLVRSDMYGDAARSTFGAMRTRNQIESGMEEERRILEDSISACDDCIDYAREGWQPIGTLPDVGEDSVCMVRCRCEKEYRRQDANGQWEETEPE